MWLPGFERWTIPGRAGVAYDEYDDPKAMWHSTEGSSVEGAVQAYQAYPPHLIVDPWRKRKFQHISLLSGAYALWNEDADDSRCVQIEVVGYSAEARRWPDAVLKWLGEEVARPLHEYFGVPYVVAPQGFKAPEDVDYILASASSPLRFTQGGLDSFSGHLAHQHSPGDSHWDVPLLIEKVLSYAQTGEGNGMTTFLRLQKDDGKWADNSAYLLSGGTITGYEASRVDATIASWPGTCTLMGVTHAQLMDHISKSEALLDAGRAAKANGQKLDRIIALLEAQASQ